uniref:Uncharacterized protein n=1 Tax=Oryza punctata TaxID=4537 RepID=A0A0E0LUE6_ORYPU
MPWHVRGWAQPDPTRRSSHTDPTNLGSNPIMPRPDRPFNHLYNRGIYFARQEMSPMRPSMESAIFFFPAAMVLPSVALRRFNPTHPGSAAME